MRMGWGKWLAAGLLVVCAGVAVAQADVIAQRRAGLKRIGEAMDAMKPIADAGGSGREQVARIDDMITWFRGLPALFPPGSDVGDTKALPAVWSARPGFEEASGKMVTQLEALRVAAASGDGAAFTSAFRATGPVCGGCHRTYRQRQS